MSFKDDVADTPGLHDAYHKGLQALGANATKVGIANPRTLAGSVDIDGSLRGHHPDAPRWDYVVGVANGRVTKLYWIEVHEANSGRSSYEVERKFRWLEEWLSNDGSRLQGYAREFHWIGTGTITFRRGSLQERRLTSLGIKFAGKHLQIQSQGGS
ncbi:MAG: hypothetical protein JST22_14860 [Bacteroidetes bacterium]|nr:hypothetical protein [Bacteroidota bacterium]